MKIIYEDSQILVCRKDSGVPVQSARVGTKDMVSMLKNYLWEKNGSGKEPYLGVIHRLDQPVEGVVVFARTPEAAASLSEQIRTGRMQKMYRAVVCIKNDTLQEQGMLIHYLEKENRGNCSKIVPRKTPDARKAKLEYRVIREIPETSEVYGSALVEIHLFTGRHHQIRVQMAGAGMPLLGDRKYGVMTCRKETDGLAEDGKKPLALCSVFLEFAHPASGEIVKFTCEPQGEYFEAFCAC